MQILVGNIIYMCQFLPNQTKSAKSMCKLTLNAVIIDFVLQWVMFHIFLPFQEAKAAQKC